MSADLISRIFTKKEKIDNVYNLQLLRLPCRRGGAASNLCPPLLSPHCCRPTHHSLASHIDSAFHSALSPFPLLLLLLVP